MAADSSLWPDPHHPGLHDQHLQRVGASLCRLNTADCRYVEMEGRPKMQPERPPQPLILESVFMHGKGWLSVYLLPPLLFVPRAGAPWQGYQGRMSALAQGM